MDYFRFGHGKETLVILPGISVQSVIDSADAIAAAYRILTNDYSIYVFDRRNELPSYYSVYDMARDTAEALQILGLDRMSIFGASQGGMIAMVLAIEHPETVQKLILGSTSACISEIACQTVGKWIGQANDGNAAALYLSFGEDIYPRYLFEKSRDFLIEASKSVTRDDLDRFVILAEGMKGFDVSADLVKITCPVLVLGSSDDRVLGPDASAQITDLLNKDTRHELYMYSGYGHAAYDIAPDYKKRMLNFLLS